MTQPLKALAAANAVRLAHAELRRDLAGMPRLSARARAADLVEAGQPSSMTLGMLLRAIPGIGRVYAASIAQRSGTSLDRRVGALSVRQRDLVAARLREQG